MFEVVRKRPGAGVRGLLLMAGIGLLLPITACNRPAPVPAGPRTFASPQEAGKALGDATQAQDRNTVLALFGPGSEEVFSSGDPAEDKAQMEGFAWAYQVMNRWRKLGDGNQLLLVGAQNEAFPVPLMKNAAGQWYFDAAAGKEEILARRIGRDELAAIDICAAFADSQRQYFSQKHGGVPQYAQKFISDPGQQNGLYWESPQGAPRSPLGPLVAFATEEGMTIKPEAAQPYFGCRRTQHGPIGTGHQSARGCESADQQGSGFRGLRSISIRESKASGFPHKGPARRKLCDDSAFIRARQERMGARHSARVFRRFRSFRMQEATLSILTIDTDPPNRQDSSMRIATLSLIATLALTPLARAQAPVFTIPPPPQSTIKFSVKASVPIAGDFTKWDATLKFTSPDVTTGMLDIEIQAATVNTGSGMKDDKLKSKDFFDVQSNPLITFKSSKITQTGPNTFDIPGTFTIRGVSKPETLTLTVAGTKGSGAGEIKGTMAFDRKDYGMNSGIPFIKIADRVEVDIDLKVKRVSGPALTFKQ